MQGTLANPINLDLDQLENEEDIEQQLQQARKKQLLEEAKLSRNGIELALAVIKTTIKGELKIKNQTLNRAIIKYFRNRIGMNISCQHFHPRKEPIYENNPINPLQFLLYGVDFLTTAMIQDRFKLIDTTLQEIKWINSSCCKLIFKTQNEAKMVLESQVIDKRTLEFKLDEQSDGRLQGWFTLRPYHFLNFQRQLMMRYATQKQKDIAKEQMNKYKEYQAAYAELLPTLFERFDAVVAFEEVMKEIDREKIQAIQNRHQYHRNRRMRNFNSRQPSRQRVERMDRSRTRDKKHQKYNNQARINQNYYDRDKNNSFQFRGRGSNRHLNPNQINTSFQMTRPLQSNQTGRNQNLNTSFQMHSNTSYQNRQNNRNSRGWQTNNNPSNSTANPNQFQANVVHQVVYQHRPVDQKQMSTHYNNNNKQRYMDPPRKKNVYFDCNGIDDEENLSYEFRSNLDDDNQESDNLEEMVMNFNQRTQNKHSKSRHSNRQDLSFLMNSLNNSKEDYVHKKLDDSLKFSKQSHQDILNKSLNDCSFLIDAPKLSDKGIEQKEKEKLDFNWLFHLDDQDHISPIHNQSNHTSFVMKDPEDENRNQANKRNDDSYLDFKKVVKNKKKNRFIEDDDGY